jgi:hypothetical protein
MIWGDAIDDTSKWMTSFYKGCRNENMAIDIYKSNNRTTYGFCIFLNLLDLFTP